MKVTLSLPWALLVLPILLVAAVGTAAHAGLLSTGVELAQQAPAMSGDVLQEKIAGPLDVDPTVTNFAALSTAAWQTVAPTVQPAPSTSNLQLETDVQLLTISNMGASGVVCWATTTRTDADCSDDTPPNAGTVTCSGTGTSADKDVVLAGTQRTVPYKGPKCIWVRASTAVVAQAEVARR